MAYQVTHLDSGETFTRPKIVVNNLQQPREWTYTTDPAIEAFHKTLPDYGETRLHNLPDVAAELGFRSVFLKDESTRFGLPAFKILGASWAIHQAICKRLNLPKSVPLDDLSQALKGKDDVRLILCTEGNWGRACARMAKYLGIACKIVVPHYMPEYTQNLLRGEGADVVVLENGSYDDCIAAVRKESRETGALLTMDTSWEGYEEFPQWVTDGYSTMLAETSRQLAARTHTSNSKPPILALASVGVGSWAQSVVAYYNSLTSNSPSPPNRILTVEPTAAPCFKESLHRGTLTPIRTGETIMNGMNCGTTSLNAWPVMRDGVFVAVTVGEREAHREVVSLKGRGVDAGPCGAATLAALRSVCEEGLEGLREGERGEVVVVLFSTEGGREYDVPS